MTTSIRDANRSTGGFEESYGIGIAATDAKCVYHRAFSLPSAGDRFFGPQAPTINTPGWTFFPESMEDIAPVSGRKVSLSHADETELFFRYNYARYRLGKLIEAQQRRFSRLRLEQMGLWFGRIRRIRESIASANMALVLAMAKRARIPNVEFSEMISEGNMAMLRAVEKFDASRGFKFSTYACRAIIKSFNRLAGKTGRYRQHFPVEFDPELEKSDYDVKRHQMQQDESVSSLRDILASNSARLSDLEMKIVNERFALGTEAHRGRTLAEVGRIVGLTNERVRQIQNLALDKIRVALDEQCLAV
ncbi:MAG: sigma-70 family RNA polymerase sigma factor [Planctomycetes bacterium]|nr:sigma-70 family RNA polymerase sigma factor [Planctomycetota bacterium]